MAYYPDLKKAWDEQYRPQESCVGAGMSAHITSDGYLRVAINASVTAQGVGVEPGGKVGQGTAECTGNFHILLKPSHHVSPIGSFRRVLTPMILRPALAGLLYSLISTKHVSNLFVRLSTNFLNTVAAHLQSRRISAQHTSIRGRRRLAQPEIYPGLPRLFNHTN